MTAALLALAAIALVGGLAVKAAGALAWADIIWQLGTAPMVAALLVGLVRRLLKGDAGLDLLALLALAAALGFGETLTAMVIALILASGRALESYARTRARRAMSALLSRAPRKTARYRTTGLETVDIEAIVPGIGCSCAPARWFRSTASSTAGRRCSTSRR